ncbi:MAG: hypothetical protein K2X53_02640 [Alphaproteobacteria bacterium]|nr:hypothetical protein [Alphaproteobacteria bacterium]
MSCRFFRPFLILTSVLLLQSHVLLASDDQREEDKQVPRRVSEAEAFERFTRLQNSQGLTKISPKKLPAENPSDKDSLKSRVRFCDATETVVKRKPSRPEDLGDRGYRFPRSRSRSVTGTGSSKTL